MGWALHSLQKALIGFRCVFQHISTKPALPALVFVLLFASIPVQAQEISGTAEKFSGYDFVVKETQAVMGKSYSSSAITKMDSMPTASSLGGMEGDGGGGVMLMSLQANPLLQTYLYDIGSLAPQSSINNLSGSFSHSIPIVIPPGRNGMQPSLAFSYNNQNTQDLNTIGYGWDIPIPFIERVNRKGVEDLYVEPVFSSSLSGELATTTDSSIFYPRSDDGSYLQYSFASSTNKWTVTDKSGTAYKFGHASTTQIASSTDPTKVYRWMLEETRDTNGNYVSYEYYKDSGFIYPSQITYTGNGATEGIFTVDFSRESRLDTATSTAPGFEIEARHRINQVLVSVDGVWVRKYDLTYTTGDNDRRSLLDTITETGQAYDTGSAVTASFPAINFDYQTVTAGWATTTTSFSVPQPFRDTYSDTGVRLLDYNGDTLPDLVRSKTGTTTLMYANDGDKWNADNGWYFPENFTDADGMDLGVRLADVNGDTLVDIIKSDGVSTAAYLNTGSGFATSTTWNSPIGFSDQYGRDNGVRFGDVNGDGLIDLLYSVWYPQYGYGSEEIYINTGAGWEASDWDLPIVLSNIWNTGGDITKETLGVAVEDVNNDGLVDLVTKDDNQYNDLEGVFLNTGSGWALESSWVIPVVMGSGGNDSGQRIVDVNGDKLVDFVDGSQAGGGDIYLNNGSNWVLDAAWTLPVILQTQNGYAVQFADVNGDSLVDIVQRNESVHNRYLNRTKVVDTLIHIDESTGSDVDVAYQSSANATLNPNLAFPIQTVTAVGKSDGLGSVATTTYQYQSGEFYFASPFDRTHAGFGTVTNTDPVGNVSKTYYHQGNASATSTGEYDDHRSKIGQAFRAEVYDDNENLYSLQVNGWDRFNRANNADFIFVATTTGLSYDGDADHRDTAESFSYSTTTGSILQKIGWGEVTGSVSGSFTDTGSDKLTTAYTYAASSTNPLLLPSQETVTNQSSVKVRETKNYYDTLSFGSITKGNLTKQELWKDSTNYIDVEKTYNSYGLVTEEKDARDKTTTFAYDTHNLHVATTSNPLSHVIGRAYDYSSGKVNRLTDANGRIFQTLYDPFDRPTEEKQPDLTTPSTLVTRTTYSYTDTGAPRRVLRTDYLGSATTTAAYTYLNALGKTVEERAEAEGSNTYAVRDFAYDLRGLLASESLPFFASSTAYTATSSPAASALVTEYEYDPLQRATSIANVLGDTTSVYDQWRVTTADALNNSREVAKDARGNLVEVVEHNDASSYTTAYEYDGNNKLTKITDAADNVRNFTYDGLGRRLTAQDLHDAGDGIYGSWIYEYDATGNLTSQVDPKSQTVTFTYDDGNRLLTENYAGAGGTEASYGYDSCAEGVGRLCTATSTDAVMALTYNALGGIASEAKTINSTAYITTYVYDRKGNISLITYPDNSQVSYVYNDAGQLESLAQKEGGGSFTSFVEDFDYSPTGRVAYKAFASGVTSTYTFDEMNLYRLINILTIASSTEGGESLMGGGGESAMNFDTSNFAIAEVPSLPSVPLRHLRVPRIENDLADEVSNVDGLFDVISITVPSIPEQSIVEESAEDIPSIASTSVPISLEVSPIEDVPVEDTSELLVPTDEDRTSEPLAEPDFIESEPVLDIATSTPEVATSTDQIIDQIFEMPVATSTDSDATSTLETLPVLPKQFSFNAIPGKKLVEGGNIRTKIVGENEKGDAIYTATISATEVDYIDSTTGERLPIDVTLVDTGDAWEIAKAPYAARISKNIASKPVTYKTGTTEIYFTLQTNTTTSAKAGEQVRSKGEFVRYPDAFGEGVDLEIRLTNEALWKEAVIADKSAYAVLTQSNGHAEVPFLIESNETIDLVSSEGDKLSKAGRFTSSGEVRVESDSGSVAYFRAPIAIDAEGNITSIAIRYEQTEAGVSLTKLLPISWLENAVYPVRTDTVVTYASSGAGDGGVKQENVSGWNTAHDASTGTVGDGGYLQAFSQKSGSNYTISRIAVPFQTAGLPDNATISGADLRVNVHTRYTADDDGNDFIRVVQTTTATTSELASGDFDQIGAIDNPTAGATDLSVSSMSSGYRTFTLNSTGLGWINVTGYTKLGLRDGHDAVDDPVDSNSGFIVYSQNHWDSNTDPELVITYTTPVPPSAPTDLLAEGQTNPSNITDFAPEFSAVYQDADDGDMATHYQLQVATSTGYWGAPIWDTGQTALSVSLTEGNRVDDISYEGSSLTASSTYYWRIKFWDQAGGSGDWSTTTASFSIANTGATITPIYKSISTGTWTAASSIALNKPSGLEEGDLMIALIATDTSVGTVPTGWTLMNSGIDSNYKVGLSVFGKVAQAADVATSTYTFTGSTWAINGSILRIADANLGTVSASLVYKAQSWGDNPSTFSPGITPSQSEALMVMAFHASQRDENFSGYTLASSSPVWTERYDSSTQIDADHMFAVAHGNRATSTPTGSFSVNTTNGNQTSEAGYGLLLAIYGNSPPTAPTSLQTEGQTNPVNVTDETPEFSAIYQDIDDGDIAAYYKVQIATSTSFTNPVWDSGKITLTASTTEGSRIPDISYAGSALTRESTYYWRIKLWDDNNTEGDWSSTANFFFAISGKSDILQDISYTYDTVGNITKITDVSGTQAAKVLLLGYDDLYRLTTASTTAASSTSFSHSYSYSSVGNIASSTPAGAYTYSETGYTNPHAPTNINGTTLGYDNNGNLTSYGTDTYAFDYRNRMASSTVSGTGATYGYDHSMQRVSKTMNSITTVYPNQYFEKANATTTKYIWAGGEVIATLSGNGVATSTEYVHSDHLGSTNVTTNESGEVNSVLDYLPFGSERISTGEELPGRGYIGQFTDREQGLSYLQNRYYSSDRGQFISQDPVFWEIGESRDGIKALFDPQSQNSYSYARNNPLLNKDPDGRYWETAFDVAMLTLSLNAYNENPGFLNGLGVIADGASLALPIPAIVGGLRHGDDALRIARVTQDVSRQHGWGKSYTLAKHAYDHAADFGLSKNDYAGYAKASKNFISNAETGYKQGSTRYDSFLDKDGRTFVFDTKTSTFGIKNADGTTATAYKPYGGDSARATKYWEKQKATKAKN